MRYRSALIGNLILVRWSAPPELEDNQSILDEVRAARQRVGRDLVLCNIVSDATAAPSAEVREASTRMTPQLLAACDSMHLVLEGDGVVRSLLRTIIRAMILAGRTGGRVALHSSFDEFLQGNGHKVSVDAAIVRIRAREAGLLA